MKKYKVVLKNHNEISVECEKIYYFDDRVTFYNPVEKEEDDIKLEVRNEEISYIQNVDSVGGILEKVGAFVQQVNMCEFTDKEGHLLTYNKAYNDLIDSLIV